MLNRNAHLALAAAACLSAFACATPDQRTYYKKAIEGFSGRIPKAPTTCWLAPDLNGGSAGADQIAEEVFNAYLLDKGLCKVIEKHPDAVAGYDWPKDDVCPCKATEQGVCAQCGSGGALPAVGGFGFGGGGSGDDNNRSGDKLLERYKKKTLPQKLIAYRIDELTSKKCVVHFRVSDVRSSVIEQAQTIVIEMEQPTARAE